MQSQPGNTPSLPRQHPHQQPMQPPNPSNNPMRPPSQAGQAPGQPGFNAHQQAPNPNVNSRPATSMPQQPSPSGHQLNPINNSFRPQGMGPPAGGMPTNPNPTNNIGRGPPFGGPPATGPLQPAGASNPARPGTQPGNFQPGMQPGMVGTNPARPASGQLNQIRPLNSGGAGLSNQAPPQTSQPGFQPPQFGQMNAPARPWNPSGPPGAPTNQPSFQPQQQQQQIQQQPPQQLQPHHLQQQQQQQQQPQAGAGPMGGSPQVGLNPGSTGGIARPGGGVGGRRAYPSAAVPPAAAVGPQGMGMGVGGGPGQAQGFGGGGQFGPGTNVPGGVQQQSMPAQPAFLQTASVPQFGSAPRPQMGGPMQQQQQQQQQPGYPQQAPAGYGQMQPGMGQGPMAGQMGQLQSGMQNMNVGGGQVRSTGPPAVNLLQRAPHVADLDTMTPPPTLPFHASVSQSPNALCPPSYKRCTLSAIPQTQAMLSKIKVPLGLVVTPYRTLQPGEEEVPVVCPPQIVRCRRCRTYVNPWVQFVEQGTRWKCNMCFLTNEVPGFFDWDPETRQQCDRMKRPELSHAVVEYIAPQEYMVRPPQPVVFVFLIDVSYHAVQSGMVECVAKALLESLDKVPNGDGRTKVAVLGVADGLFYFNLNASLTDPQMLVVADIDDPFLPLPDDLLVPFTESRIVFEKLVKALPVLFRSATTTQNCLGRALQVAQKMISAIGGKIVVFQSSLANLSEGGLKPREDPKILGTPKEVTLLQPQSQFYKAFAVDCSRCHISVDLFAFHSQYLDLATIGSLPKVTGGCAFYYPTFNPSNPQDQQKLTSELQHYFARPLALEAVLRVRASKGLKMSRFHGNFFLRSTDLLALPTVDPDNSYAIEMEIQDPLPGSVACFQTALLHTSSNGERRIRVLTMAVPVTDAMGELVSAADQYAIATLMAKKGVEKCLISNLDSARDEIVNRLTDIIGAYKAAFTSSGQNSMLILPENLKLLPLLVMSMLKHIAFRTSGVIPSDLRTFAQAMMSVYPTEALIPAIHPRFFALHTMDATCGHLDESTGSVLFPPTLNLSSEKLERAGLYLLENGAEILLWVGRGISPELCQAVFGVPHYEAIVFGKNALPQLPNETSQRVNNIISSIKQRRLLMMTTSPNVYVVKEDGDPNLRMMFLSQLVEDKLDSGNSYPLFLGYLREKMAKPASMF